MTDNRNKKFNYSEELVVRFINSMLKGIQTMKDKYKVHQLSLKPNNILNYNDFNFILADYTNC